MPRIPINKTAGMAVVLVKPQLGENIGATARIMLNFGVQDLRLVKPRDGWPNSRAVAMASGAGRILDDAEICSDIGAALREVNYVYATTARRRDIRKLILHPLEAMADAQRRIAEGQRVAVVFGPERAGLENTDLAAANAVIEIPVNQEFKSINLAQSVAVICYEWMRSGSVEEVEGTHIPATVSDKTRFVDILVENLHQSDYFWPPENATGMELNLRNLFMRMELTGAELRTLHGIRRALIETRRQKQSVKSKYPDTGKKDNE